MYSPLLPQSWQVFMQFEHSILSTYWNIIWFVIHYTADTFCFNTSCIAVSGPFLNSGTFLSWHLCGLDKCHQCQTKYCCNSKYASRQVDAPRMCSCPDHLTEDALVETCISPPLQYILDEAARTDMPSPDFTRTQGQTCVLDNVVVYHL